MSDLPAFTKVLERSSTTGTARLVLLAIASFAKRDGTGAWPSRGAIQHRAGLGSSRTVDRTIRRLEAAGELEVSYKAGRHGCNLYRVVCAEDPMSDLDTAMSRSDVDTAMSTSSEVMPTGPRHSEPQTWTSGAPDLDISVPERRHSSVARTGRTGALEQEREQDVRPAAFESGGRTRVSVDPEAVHGRLAASLPERAGQLEAVRAAFEEFSVEDAASAVTIAVENGSDHGLDGVAALRVGLRFKAAQEAGENWSDAWLAALAAEGIEEAAS